MSDTSTDCNNDTRPAAAVTNYNFPALIFGILLIVIITGGNVLVCLSVYLEKALKTTTNYFIVSLAFADLLLAVLVLPLFVYAEVSTDLHYPGLTRLLNGTNSGPQGVKGGLGGISCIVCSGI